MNSRRFMCASLGEITPYHTIAREQVLCITAKLIVEWQTWVQTRSFGDVGSMSGLPESGRNTASSQSGATAGFKVLEITAG